MCQIGNLQFDGSFAIAHLPHFHHALACPGRPGSGDCRIRKGHMTRPTLSYAAPCVLAVKDRSSKHNCPSKEVVTLLDLGIHFRGVEGTEVDFKRRSLMEGPNIRAHYDQV